MVVFFHLGEYWALVPELHITKVVTHWGFAGVDIFFVLSGFVVYQSADKSQFDVRKFLTRRAMRIYLGYWPVLLALVVLSFFGLTYPSEHRHITSVLLLEPFMWNNWLPTAWSLTYELYFYLWVAIICALRWVPRGLTLLLFILVILLWNMGFLLLYPAEVYAGHQTLRFPMTALGLEFLAGAGIAHIYQRHRLMVDRPTVIFTIGCLLVFGGFALGTTSPQFDTIDILRAGSYGLAAMGALLAVLAMSKFSIRAPRLLVAIGDASYSLYLIHPILLWITGTFQFRHLTAGSYQQLGFLLLVPVLIVITSLFWFRWVEQPLFQAVANDNLAQRLLDKWKNRSSA
jgi:peptidoglycan/LPS O-acetylase OafA/YrhL